MPRDIDALTSFTLKHLRDRWWDASFTAFLQEALLPQAGERVLDVGCGAGTAELILSALQPGGVHFVGIDLVQARLRDARRAMREQGVAAELAAADAARLPFAPASFDAAFAVAVLQHVPTPRAVIDALRRVLRPGGRLVLAEPDNARALLVQRSGVRARGVRARHRVLLAGRGGRRRGRRSVDRAARPAPAARRRVRGRGACTWCRCR